MEAIYSDYQPVFLYVDRYQFSQLWSYPEGKVPYALLRYILSGSAVFVVDGQSYTVRQDDVFYIPEGSSLACSALEEISFISIRFVGSISMPERDILSELWRIPRQCFAGEDSQMRDWFSQVYCSAVSDHTYKRLEIRGLLNLILARLARMSAGHEGSDPQTGPGAAVGDTSVEWLRYETRKSELCNDPRITVLSDYIITHPQENLSRADMCRIADVGESTLRRLFKRQTGKTIYQFVREVKINAAARRLLTSNEPVASVAYYYGYDDPRYFAKCFKEVYGVSPIQFRNISHDV